MPARSINHRSPAPPPPRSPGKTCGTRSSDFITRHERSAGGLVINVVNGTPYAAVIARFDRYSKLEWYLPKGHLEGKETPEEAAIREVAEETGIRGDIICPLSTIDYWFCYGNYRIHKHVHHFLMEYVSGSISVEGDPDHEAETAKWFPLHDLSTGLAYANERKIVIMALALLYGEH